MDCKKRPNKGQTNRVSFKNSKKIQKTDGTIETASVHHDEAGEPQYEAECHLLLLLLLINDGIQSSSQGLVARFRHFWSPFVYKATSYSHPPANDTPPSFETLLTS
jgi:hypothetical protein